MFKVELLEMGKKRVKNFEINTMVEVLEIYGDTDKNKELFNVYQDGYLLFTVDEMEKVYKRYFKQWRQKTAN